jgi:hypothetical protein
MLPGPCRQVQNLTFLLILSNNARSRLIQTPAFYFAGDPNINEAAKILYAIQGDAGFFDFGEDKNSKKFTSTTHDHSA